MTNPEELRAQVLEDFCLATGCPPLRRITQRGRDPDTARFTLELSDGREVRVGTIKHLWSQTELAKVIAVACGVVLSPVKASDWREMLAALVAHAIDVEEIEGESFEDTVREWISGYLDIAGLDADRDGAAAQGKPFRADGTIHIHAQDLAKYIRREQGESVSLFELRAALVDLGFERRTIPYTRSRKKNTRSYYVIDAAALGMEGESP